MARIGITTALSINPSSTTIQLLPELYPKKGGKIKLPAPKNRENKAKAVIKVCLVNLIGYCIFALQDTRMTITHKGVPIYYTESGQGDTLVLLHGFLENSTMWHSRGVSDF